MNTFQRKSVPFCDVRCGQFAKKAVASFGIIYKLAPREKIISLPLEGAVRQEFIETADAVFKDVLDRIESKHPKLIRRMWNAESYIDNELLKPEMLPIDHYYALSLIDAFLVHHVIALAIKADEKD
ncbi:hypothetical protein [Pedobacter sp.]